MTTATVAQVVDGIRRPRQRTRPSVASSFLEEARARLELATGIRWPNGRYYDNPVGFARDILGIEPWEKQIEILEAARDYERVTVRSGHKIGKSHTAAILAYWFYCTRDDARVVMTSTTARQVDEILWREISKMRAHAGVCLACKKAAQDLSPIERARLPVPCPHSARIDGKIGQQARSGLRAPDLRQIVGFTARDAEAVAGISGANILYICDEASGIAEAIFAAIEGNRAGGGRIVLISNPTRTEGEFFRSHTDKAIRIDSRGERLGFYKAIHVSSEDTPNARTGRRVIPGLATREYIEEKRAEWGEESALYKVRIKGEFVVNEEGRIVSVHAVTEAEKSWPETPAKGRLYIGLDPAGPGEAGDETVFATRRGLKVLGLDAHRGLDEDGIVRELIVLLRRERLERELPPVVVVDREGPIGASIFFRLRAIANGIRDDMKKFEVVGVRASDRAAREPEIYDRTRDELYANLARWLRDGGALPEDARLAKDLTTPEWFTAVNGKLKATRKEDLRKALDRSPDRGDAVMLSVWESTIHRASADDDDELHAAADDDEDLEAAAGFDPYGALDAWGRS